MFCFGHIFIDYVFEAWLPLAPSKTSGACHFIAHRVWFSYRSKADQIQQANPCRICYRGKSEIISCGPLTVLLAQQAVNLIYDIVWICFSAILSFRVSALTCLRISPHISLTSDPCVCRGSFQKTFVKTPLLIVKGDETRLTNYKTSALYLTV